MHIALEAQKKLKEQRIGARVVSMPSWEIFEQQPTFYQLNVLPEAVIKRLAIEVGSPLGWWKYVGTHGAVMGLERFGASAPAHTLQKELGFTTDDVVQRAVKLMAK